MKIYQEWRLKLRFNLPALVKHIAVTALICFVASIFLRANFWLVFIVVEIAFFSNIFILGKGQKKNPFMKNINNEDVIDIKSENNS